MVFGLKRIFKKKSKAPKTIPSSPEATKTVPETPPTQPVKEDPPGIENHDRRDDDLPVQNLLQIPDYDLGTTNSGEIDYVFEDSEYPDDEPSPHTVEPTTVGDSGSTFGHTPPRGGNTNTTIMTMMEEPEIDEDHALQEQADFSPLRPRNLEASDVLVKTASDDNDDKGYLGQVQGVENVAETKQVKYDATKSLMSMFERAKQFAIEPCLGGIVLPEPIQKLVPTVDNAMLCQPQGVTRHRSDPSTSRPTVVREYSYYDEQFALKFLDELINVGYALVHHQFIVDSTADEEGNCVGHSVTLILRPGICNILQVQAPFLELATLGGGQQAGIETTAISLLDIHSIGTSTTDDIQSLANDGDNPDDEDEKEDLQCFFSITTKEGQIYVMETINPDESQRLVAGIKNLTSRLSKQLIAGDKNVLCDFFDNSQEADEIKVTEDEAMSRVSHALLDYLSR